ncbi:hypothetical protein MKX01_037762 [Papaver californicum]|nr:hypothetical protein MKX01_037762 [Papaver californicum]
MSRQCSCGRVWSTLEFLFHTCWLSLLTSLINVHSRYYGVLGLSILIGYQLCLSSGLNEFLLSNDRINNLFS